MFSNIEFILIILIPIGSNIYKLESKSCSKVDECASQEICLNTTCVDACTDRNCLIPNSECYGLDHEARCRCKAGYDGDVKIGCRPKGKKTACSADEDCGSSEKCSNKACIDACSDQSCAKDINAACFITHEAVCQCKSGFEKGTSGCKPKGKTCVKPDDCGQTEICKVEDGVCVSGCLNTNCGDPNSECDVKDHKAFCHCKSGFRRIHGGCSKDDKPAENKCSTDKDCQLLSDKCVQGVCTDACKNANCNDANAVCVAMNHEPICKCKTGFDRIDGACKSVQKPPTREKIIIGDGSKTWYKAYEYCIRKNRTLAVIHNQAEDEEFYSEIEKLGGKESWIGGMVIKDRLEWITGEPVEYTNWVQWTPDVAELRIDGCIMVSARPNVKRYSWNSYHCNNNQPYFCIYHD